MFPGREGVAPPMTVPGADVGVTEVIEHPERLIAADATIAMPARCWRAVMSPNRVSAIAVMPAMEAADNAKSDVDVDVGAGLDCCKRSQQPEEQARDGDH